MEVVDRLMADQKQINIRVPARTKEEWAEYAEEHHGSLTRLISLAVTREIEGDHGEFEQIDEASIESLQDLQNSVDSVENTVRELDKKFHALRETVEESSLDLSVKSAVRETLNEYPMEELPEDVPADRAISGGLSDAMLSSEEIAARLGAEVSIVSDALDELRRRGEVKKYRGPDGVAYLLIEQ